MERTEEMVQAEVERMDLLNTAGVFLDAASDPAQNDYIREQFLEESIRNLMIGSHAGRIG